MKGLEDKEGWRDVAWLVGTLVAIVLCLAFSVAVTMSAIDSNAHQKTAASQRAR